MENRLALEQQRLIADSERSARAVRRSTAFTAQLVVANSAFALAPALSHSKVVFGALEPWHGPLFVAPSLFALALSVWLYRRQGHDAKAYRVSEDVETLLLYGLQLAFVVQSGLRWSALWALCPFSAVFFGLTMPFRQRFYAALFAGSHFAAALLQVLLGRSGDAAVTVGFGACSYAVFALISRQRRAAVLAQAELGLVRAQLAEQQVDAERQAVARELALSVVAELDGFAVSLKTDPSLVGAQRQADAALRELGRIVSPVASHTLPTTVGALVALLKEKLVDLCVGVRCTVESPSAVDTPLASSSALALLRIGQELVRNAVTHGHAQSLQVVVLRAGDDVTLSVRDDGVGLRAERFDEATGGLHNAKRWADEQSGTLERFEHREGTELRARVRTLG